MLGNIVLILWVLALLGAALWVRDSRRQPRALLAAVLGFVLAWALALGLLSPQANWIGVLLGLAAGLRLLSGTWPRAGAVVGGGSAGLAAALLTAAAVPTALALALSLAALLLVFLWRPAESAASRPHDAVLAWLTLGAPLLGLFPDLVYGWQSAMVLNQGVPAATRPWPAPWAALLPALALLAGALRAIWIQR